MIEFDPEQRSLIADKLFDAANVAVGGMVFGQFVASRPFSTALAIAGLAIWVTLVVASITAKGRKPS